MKTPLTKQDIIDMLKQYIAEDTIRLPSLEEVAEIEAEYQKHIAEHPEMEQYVPENDWRFVELKEHRDRLFQMKFKKSED